MNLKNILFISLLIMLLLGTSINVFASETDNDEEDTVLVTFKADRATVIKQEEVKKGSKIVFPEPATDTDFEFDGWIMSPDDADVNNIQTDVTFKQKWKEKESYRPIDPYFPEILKKEEEELKQQDEYINTYNKISKESKTIKPKLSYDKKKKKIIIKTDKKVTDIAVYYSTYKTFKKPNTAEFKLKNGKATISLKKLKKLKKNKTYYVMVIGILKQELYGQEMINYTKVSKTVKIKNKKKKTGKKK